MFTKDGTKFHSQFLLPYLIGDISELEDMRNVKPNGNKFSLFHRCIPSKWKLPLKRKEPEQYFSDSTDLNTSLKERRQRYY